jgi:hypothetical protein
MLYKDDFCCCSYTPALWCREKRDILERNNEDLSLQIRSEVTERCVEIKIENRNKRSSAVQYFPFEEWRGVCRLR